MERHATTPRPERGGAWGIGLIGTALVATAVVYSAGLSRIAVYPVFDAVVLFVLGGTVAATGYWLGRSEIAGPELWRIATAVGLGVITMATVTGWLLLAQARQGVPLQDPLVTLAITTTVGAVAGLLVGVYHVDAVRQARDAREARASAREARRSEKQLRFLTRLLRHHLLNGIQVIRSHAEFLSGHVDPEGERHVETIRCRSDRLAGLLENVRTLATAYEREPALEPVGLLDAVETQAAVVERVHPGCTVEVSVTDSAISVTADELLPVVFETLLETAIERTGVADPTVSATVERRDGRAIVTVTAPGPERGDGSGTLSLERDERGAVGEEQLGFYVVDHLVGGYGGDLRVDEDGSRPRYCVELPLAE